MRITRPRTILAAAAVAAAMLASCGDDSVEALPKPEFLEQANAICQVAQDKADEVFEGVWADPEDPDMDEAAMQDLLFDRFDVGMEQLMPIYLDMIGELRSLGAPEGDEDLLATLLDDLESGIEEFDELLDAAAEGDIAAREALDGDDPMVDLNRRAREYGLTVCGEDG